MTNLRQNQILVVEDDQTLVSLSLKQLALLGFSSEAVVDGQQAVEKVSDRNYQAIIMDIFLPVLDGLEATRRIRRIEKEQDREHSLIIGVTASNLREQCLEAGMDDFMFKPILLNQLKAVLNRWIQ